MAAINKMLAASNSPWRERAMGIWGDNWALHLCHGTNREGEFEIYINMDGGGCGGAAFSTRDGIPVAGCPQQCGMDLPDVEFNEMNFPLFFQFKRLRQNSGGPGRHRGGLGLEYAWSIYGVPEMNTVLFNQRHAVPHIGMFGAPLVSSCTFIHFKDSDVKERVEAQVFHPITLEDIPGEQIVTSVNDQTTILSDRDVFYVANLGGGGYADPASRDAALVAKDVREEWIDRAQAEFVYGVVVDDQGQIDEAATKATRDIIRKKRLARAVDGTCQNHLAGTKEAVAYHHSPAIDIGRYDGNLMYQCAETAVIIGPAQKNWKKMVPRIERRIDQSYLEDHVAEIGIRTDPALISREYICPVSGVLLEVELAVEGDPIEHDCRPAHYYEQSDGATQRQAG